MGDRQLRNQDTGTSGSSTLLVEEACKRCVAIVLADERAFYSDG